MKKILCYFFIMGYCLLSTSQTIINSFPAPTSLCGDIAFDGQHLWIGGQEEYELFQISTTDGSIIRTIPSSIRSPYGLTFDGNDLWIVDTENENIQRIDTLDGTVLATFPSPKSTPSNPVGLAWDGNHVWNNDFGNFGGSFDNYPFDSTFAISTTGTLVQAHASFGKGPTGLGYGDGYFYSADSETDQIYIINASDFTLVDSFPTVGGTHPNGIAWDGTYLWIANNDQDSIYQLDVSSLVSSIPIVEENQLEVNIFPNPGREFINIVINTPLLPEFELTDVTGRIIHPSVHQSTGSTYSLNLTNLNIGIYYLSIYVGQKRTTKLILKQ